MLLRLTDILDPKAARRIGELLGDAEFDEANSILGAALVAHPLFLLAAMPKSISEAVFTRFDSGLPRTSPAHGAIIGSSRPIRADMVVSVCLSDPEDYDGGELVVDSGYGEERFKEGIGAGVIYPASRSHRVATVTRGSRMAADIFVQSQVRDPPAREILYDISWSLEYLDIFGRGVDAQVDRLRRCRESLLRLWADP